MVKFQIPWTPAATNRSPMDWAADLGTVSSPTLTGCSAKKRLQCIRVVHRNPGDLGPHRALLYVKGGQQLKAVVGELKIFNKRPSQVAGAQHHDGVAPVDAQDLSDLFLEPVHLISIALLAESAKTKQILPDLGGGQPHRLAQGAGGDADHPLALELGQLTVVTGAVGGSQPWIP